MNNDLLIDFRVLADYRDTEIEVKVARSIFADGNMLIGLQVWTREKSGWKFQPTKWCDTEKEALSLFNTIVNG
jgi:hypothetical protein